MKSFTNTILTATLLLALFPSCKKKKTGVCYCHYLSGDKKEFDLNNFERSKQIDSCYELDKLALNFAGDCELK